MSRCNLQATTNGFLIYKQSPASASIIHLYDERVLSTRACFCLYRTIQRIPKARVFLGTEHLSDPTSWAEFPARRSAVKLAMIVIPSQGDAGEDVNAECIILLLMIFQKQSGTASEAQRESKSDASDILPGEKFVSKVAAVMPDKTQSDGLENASAHHHHAKQVGKTFQNSFAVGKC